MDDKLLDYINQELERGTSLSVIKQILQEAGWSDVLIEEACYAANNPPAEVPVPQPGFVKKQNSWPAENSQDDDVLTKNDLQERKGKDFPVKAAIIAITLILLASGVVWAYLSFSANSGAVVVNNIVPVKERQDSIDFAKPLINDLPATTTELAADVADVSATTTTAVGFGTKPSKTVLEESKLKADPILEKATTTVDLAQEAGGRDAQRMADMQAVIVAQKTWYNSNKKFYTCGLKSGDCGGLPTAYPLQIPDYSKMPQDPLDNGKGVCGKDYVYCGLSNAVYPQYFCYYAKLESGGYYSATPTGNFRIANAPKTFKECISTK